MRLSRIWRILQIKEGVIHRGRRPRWITPSEISRILHILRKPNSRNALLFIQNINLLLLKGVSPLCSLFFCSPNITQPCPQVFSVNSSTICNGLHFWRHLFYMAKILSKFGEQQLVMVNYSCGFNQSETRKYFEWKINRVRNCNSLVANATKNWALATKFSELVASWRLVFCPWKKATTQLLF